MQSTADIQRTPLYDAHLALGARMVPFAGYEMPIQYSGIVDEHMAVRRAAGMFDVSHMGEVMVRGPRAAEFVRQLVSNDVSSLYDGRAMYAVMCFPDGGIVDDLLVYRIGAEEYMLVVNASTCEKDLEWIRSHNTMGAEVEDVSDETALIAIQGPAAMQIVQSVTSHPVTDLKYYHFAPLPSGAFFGSRRAILSHTGYTGEPGVEVYCDPDRVEEVWNALLQAGAPHDLKPAGLGARDTLRLEAGYCLYGNDIDDTTSPLEAGLGWVTKLGKGDFVGRDALQQQKDAGLKRKLVGFVLEDRGIPRAGYPIVNSSGEEIGTVTSGSQSPILNQGIGLGYVRNEASYTEPGSEIAVSVRGKPLKARVAKPPFHKK